MRSRLLLGPVLSLLAVAAMGCNTAVAFEPKRELVRSIPRDMAKAALEELLRTSARPVSEYLGRGEPFTEVVVTDAGFEFSSEFPVADGGIVANSSTHLEKVHRSYRYDEIQPQGFRLAGREDIAMRLKASGRLAQLGSRNDPANPGNDCFFFAREEDAEKFLEAIASLKASPSGSGGD